MSNTSLRPIALLTDFGTTDTYVGSLKAAIYNVASDVPIIDICHHIRPQNILQAAFVLRMIYRDYPEGTIFVCVVDPGVGGKRLPIAVEAGSYYFIGPDNGIFSYIYEREAVKRIVHLSNERLWRHPVSATFHGRDIFAPCAAHLAQDGNMDSLGEALQGKPQKLSAPNAEYSAEIGLNGQVMHIDRFGNLITNIHLDDYQQSIKTKAGLIEIADWEIPLGRTYEQAARESLLAVWGSTGFLEISARNGSALEVLDSELNEPVTIQVRNDGS